MHRIAAVVVSVWLVVGAAEPARASVILTLTPVGSDVAISGSGSFDLSALTLSPVDNFASPALNPTTRLFLVGPLGTLPVDLYSGLSGGPGSFGTGLSTIAASAGSGQRFGLVSAGLVVPDGYVSKSPLSASNTYAGATLASLGVTPGTYVYTWGSGATADTLTLQINAATPPAVPEPASLTLLGLGLAGLGARRWRQRRDH